jgi:hypothetical protein
MNSPFRGVAERRRRPQIRRGGFNDEVVSVGGPDFGPDLWVVT